MAEKLNYCKGTPLSIGNETTLLIDDAYVEDRWGVYRHLNIPIKMPSNPVLLPDLPWESYASSPSVIYDEQDNLFRMWYSGWDELAYRHQFDWGDWRPEHGSPYYICYAESHDGLHWEKPLLDHKPYKHYSKTNVVMTGIQKAQGTWVIPNDPSSGQPGRFLMCYKDNLPDANASLCLAYSDNGIDWRPDPANPVITGIRDTRHNLVFDPKRKRWLFFTRPMCFAGTNGLPGGPDGENYKRRAAVAIGDTLGTLSYPRCILWPDEHDKPDYDDFLVNRVGNHFLALSTHMDAPPERQTTTHLLSSPDGLHWNRLPDRTPLIGLGKEGSFDAGQAASVSPIVTVGDKMYLYYYGSVHGQGARENISAIGMAKIQRDRFVAQMGKHTGGFLLTREIVIEGRQLEVNITLADAHNTAEYDPGCDISEKAFSVELIRSPQDGPPAPIPGYTFADCTATATDAVSYVITWKGK